MLWYTPESNIESSIIDLPVQSGVPLKPSTNVSGNKTPIHKTKLTHVLVMCRHVLNKLRVPDCWMFVCSICGSWTFGEVAVWRFFADNAGPYDVFVAMFFHGYLQKKLAFQWCRYIILHPLSMHLQFECTVQHIPKLDKGSFTMKLHVHSGEDSVKFTYVIISLILVALFQIENTICAELMKALMSPISLPRLFAFSPLILLNGGLESWHKLGISPRLMGKLQT
jgi:hypothetical protein